jgi:hypothetical protein
LPTFCRHGRFLERCPICSKTLPGNAPTRRPAGGSAKRRTPSHSGSARRTRGETIRVQRQQRAAEDGYSSSLLPGVRASADAARLADELAFSNGRLLTLAAGGEDGLPALYAQAQALAASELEQATWICFLCAYLCPLEGPEPFAGIEAALRSDREALEDLSEIELGPRTSHDRARGAETLNAYRGWYRQAGSQAAAFQGDSSWTPERRFERIFERLALPGFTRAARYELLMLLGALGLYELRGASLQLSGPRGSAAADQATLAAKRVFAIGDPLLLERRAKALADACSTPIAALEPALADWGSDARATRGFPDEVADEETRRRAQDALGL